MVSAFCAIGFLTISAKAHYARALLVGLALVVLCACVLLLYTRMEAPNQRRYDGLLVPHMRNHEMRPFVGGCAGDDAIEIVRKSLRFH